MSDRNKGEQHGRKFEDRLRAEVDAFRQKKARDLNPPPPPEPGNPKKVRIERRRKNTND